jgi:hypothetical protein
VGICDFGSKLARQNTFPPYNETSFKDIKSVAESWEENTSILTIKFISTNKIFIVGLLEGCAEGVDVG